MILAGSRRGRRQRRERAEKAGWVRRGPAVGAGTGGAVRRSASSPAARTAGRARAASTTGGGGAAACPRCARGRAEAERSPFLLPAARGRNTLHLVHHFGHVHPLPLGLLGGDPRQQGVGAIAWFLER